MRENKTLEFKRKISNTFLKTVSAFANFNDGLILFGVDDNGNPIGIENLDSTCMDIENKINDAISPKPDFTLSVEDKVIRLHVKKGRYTPYLYKGKAYRRSDTASVEVDQVELRRLVLDAANQYYEELSCNMQDLTFNYLKDKLMKRMSVKSVTEDVLKTLGFVSADGTYNNAAAVFADKNDFYGIDIARFGQSINQLLDRETVAGISVLQQYDEAVKTYRRYYQHDEIVGMERKTVVDIPEEAFREAVANALVHREWDLNSHVRISLYDDYIEINSPGGLPKGLGEKEYLNGEISCLRNPIIGNVFFRLHYIEMFGTGIRRILEAYKNAERTPTFKISDNVISIVLPTLNPHFKVTSDEGKIIEVLKNNAVLASGEISQRAGFTKSKTLRLLRSLKDMEYVKCEGNGRSTKYHL